MPRMNWDRAQQVRKERSERSTPDTLPPPTGSGNCWCGGGFNHNWPGKENGQPHPR